MANINAHLPPTIAVPFHPPTENLQHDNLIKPVIPKTEIISSYTKLRDEQERTQFSAQSRDIFQDENDHNSEQPEDNNPSSQHRRSYFFARRGNQFISESESGQAAMPVIEDFKQVMSVIESRYNNAVQPFSEPTVNLAI